MLLSMHTNSGIARIRAFVHVYKLLYNNVYTHFHTYTNFPTHDYAYFFTSTNFPNHVYVYYCTYTNYVFLRIYILKHVYKQHISRIRVFTHVYVFFSCVLLCTSIYNKRLCVFSHVYKLIPHFTYT